MRRVGLNAAAVVSFLVVATSAQGVDRFEVGPVSSPQCLGGPFPVTITAMSGDSAVAMDYSGNPSIYGCLIRDVGLALKTWSLPLACDYQTARTQVIYPASDIGAAGSIVGLGLDVTSLPGGVLTNWTIRLKHTALTNYATSPVWETNGWITVYQADLRLSNTGWVTFAFATPFDYNGADSLMVDFSYRGSGGGAAGNCRVGGSSVDRTIYRRTNTDQGDPLGWAGRTPTPSASTNVPIIRLVHLPTQAIPVEPQAVSGFVDGVWTGSVSVLATGSNVCLRVDDGAGRSGISAPFDVTRLTSLVVESVLGMADPATGVYYYAEPTSIVFSVLDSPILNGTTQYQCIGWTGGGSVPSEGQGTNAGPFVVAEDSRIVWRWQTNYYLDIELIGNGTVDVEDGWRTENSVVSATATAGSGSRFVEWRGDTNGCAVQGDAIAVVMDRPRLIEARFDSAPMSNDTLQSWLAQYYGTTNDFGALAQSDSDGDGMPAWREYRAGTDPTNGGSCFKVVDAVQTSDGFEIRWPSVSGRVYSVYRSTNGLADWSLICTTNPGTSESGSFVDSSAPLAGGESAFYLIRTSRQE